MLTVMMHGPKPFLKEEIATTEVPKATGPETTPPYISGSPVPPYLGILPLGLFPL